MSTPLIAPSILAADPARFGEEILSITSAGADWVHIDVMDGSFVPPITFGANVVAMAKVNCDLLLDVHLMIEKPELHLQVFGESGADRLIVHQEASPHLHRTLGAIHDLGMKAGVAVNPGTPVETIFPVLDRIDLALVMTVNPGWGGQKFLSSSLPKITALHKEIERQQQAVLIEVDGGINEATAKACVDAGASVLVAGSYIFQHTDRAAAITSLRT